MNNEPTISVSFEQLKKTKDLDKQKELIVKCVEFMVNERIGLEIKLSNATWRNEKEYRKALEQKYFQDLCVKSGLIDIWF